MSTFEDRTNSSILRIYEKYAKPIKLIFTKTSVTGDIGSVSKTDVIFRNNEELIKGFFKSPTTKEGISILDTYDGELILNDITFDLFTFSFSVGTYHAFTSGDTLKINNSTINMSTISNIDDLISAIGALTNVFCYKLTSTTFMVISTIDDFQNDTEYMNLKVEGTCQALFGLEATTSKASVKVKINNITYSIIKIFNGDYVKSLFLKRG
jgi:hypothetical protein